MTSQLSAPADNAPLITTPVYERPAGHGALEGVDPFSTVSTEAAVPAFVISLIDPATGRPADRGFLEGPDGAVSAPVNRQPAHGPVEGVD
jgi:hypothetical protein